MSWGACCTHALGIPADTPQPNTETLSKDEETILKCWCPADSAIPCTASSDLFFWVFFSFTVMQNNRQAPHTGQFLPIKDHEKLGRVVAHQVKPGLSLENLHKSLGLWIYPGMWVLHSWLQWDFCLSTPIHIHVHLLTNSFSCSQEEGHTSRSCRDMQN